MSDLIIPFSSIDLTANRDMGDLSGLQDSLQRLGTIHPPALSRYTTPTGEVRYKPVAGRRRLHALHANGVKELYHNSTLEPTRPGFCFKEEVPEDELQEATLDENLYRLKPKWQEDALLIADVHELKRKKHGPNKWGQRQTAELLSKGGKGFGKSSVNLALKVADLLRAGDKEILACDSLDDANTVRIKRAEDKALERLQQQAMSTAGVMPTAVTADVSSFLDSFNMELEEGEPSEAAPTVAEALNVLGATAPKLQAVPQVAKPPVQIPLSQLFTLGNMLDAVWTPTNHIVTDIPYGIDMDNLNKKQVVDVSAEHEVEANVDLMPKFLQKAYDNVLPHGFCVFFYDLDHHEKLQQWATEVGWKVQRWPLIWVKTHACQNNAAQYNTTKNFEVAMVLRKDEQTVLRSVQSSSVWTGDGAAERKLYNNPFAKPFELWKWIYDMIAFPGQTVRDPYCGEMSACRAAANCGLVPYGNEINVKHFNRGLEHMKAVYALIHKSNVQFV